MWACRPHPAWGYAPNPIFKNYIGLSTVCEQLFKAVLPILLSAIIIQKLYPKTDKSTFYTKALDNSPKSDYNISQSDFGLKYLPTRRISLDNKNNRKKLYEYNNVLKSIDDCYRNIAKRYGFSEAAFWTLYTLRMEPGNITQSDVCTVLYQPKQTVNSALKKLESDGYITLTPAGAHTKNISLTKSGTKLCEQTVDKVIEAECAALGNMTDEETENMTALMKLYSILLKNQTAKI